MGVSKPAPTIEGSAANLLFTNRLPLQEWGNGDIGGLLKVSVKQVIF